MTISRHRTAIVGGLLLASLLFAMSAEAHAQAAPSADSLVARFLNRGILGNWSPASIFQGCPNLAPWQERALTLLLEAELSPLQSKDLALSWSGAVESCRDPRLERWFFDQIEAAIRAGEPADAVSISWVALARGDSPAIRAFLWEMMLNESLPPDYRNSAGGTLFQRFSPEERRREYFRAFLTRRMPAQVAWGQTDKLLQDDGDRTLRETARLVRQQPHLTQQTAFSQLVGSSDRYASDAARRALAESLDAVLADPDTSDAHRHRLRGFVAVLQTPRAERPRPVPPPRPRG